jgi:hypothetical protein
MGRPALAELRLVPAGDVWGRHLDRLGTTYPELTDPGLCLHSLRHGFRETCRAALLMATPVAPRR